MGQGSRRPANPRCCELGALHVGDREIEFLLERGAKLRALNISSCSRENARRLADSGLLARVERLGIGQVEDAEPILAAVPRLRALGISGVVRYGAAIPATVVEFECAVKGGIDVIAALAIAPTLERLRIDAEEFTWDLDALATFRRLRSLDLRGSKPAPSTIPFAIEQPPELPGLRELSLGLRFDAQTVEQVARAFGPQLDTLHWSARMRHDLVGRAALDDFHAPLKPGDAGVASHVAGEFIVGMWTPWARRPLEYGDDSRGPWFEGGGVRV